MDLTWCVLWNPSTLAWRSPRVAVSWGLVANPPGTPSRVGQRPQPPGPTSSAQAPVLSGPWSQCLPAYLLSSVPVLPGESIQASLPLAKEGKRRNEQQRDIPGVNVIKEERQAKALSSRACSVLHEAPGEPNTHTQQPRVYVYGGQGAYVKGQGNHIPISASHLNP